MAKIGKRTSAKKYAHIRILQAQANKMLYKSTHIEKSHGKRKQVLAMKRQFYKSRGIKNPSRLSFRNLSPKDIKAYEKLLKSIIENTYINPEKYKQYQQKMEKIFNENHYGVKYEEVKDIFESDIGDELSELGLGYKDFWETYAEVNEEYSKSFTVENFIEMLKAFKNDVDLGSFNLDDFYVYADAWYSGYIDKEYDLQNTEIQNRLKDIREQVLFDIRNQ